jgi:hypothetical protein
MGFWSSDRSGRRGISKLRSAGRFVARNVKDVMVVIGYITTGAGACSICPIRILDC